MWRFFTGLILCVMTTTAGTASGAGTVDAEMAAELMRVANSYRGVQSGRFVGLSTRHSQPSLAHTDVALRLIRYEADIRSRWEEGLSDPQISHLVTKTIEDIKQKMQAEGKAALTNADVIDYDVKRRVRNETVRLEAESEQRTDIQRFDIKVSGDMLAANLRTVALQINGRDTQRAGFVTSAVIGKQDYRSYRTDSSLDDTGRVRGFGSIRGIPTSRSGDDLDLVLRQGDCLNVVCSPDMFRYAYHEKTSEGDVVFIVTESDGITRRIGLLEGDGHRPYRYEAYVSGLPTVVCTFSSYQNTSDGGRYPHRITRTSVRSATLSPDVAAKLQSGAIKVHDRQVLDSAVIQAFDSWDIKLETVLTNTSFAESDFDFTFPEGTEVSDDRSGRELKYTISQVESAGPPISERVIKEPTSRPSLSEPELTSPSPTAEGLVPTTGRLIKGRQYGPLLVWIGSGLAVLGFAACLYKRARVRR